MIRHKETRQLFFFFLLILWAAIIFYLSSIPDLASGLPSVYDFVLRKFAHIVIFAVLAFLMAASLDNHRRPYIYFVAIAAIIYALGDEIHQTSILNRSGNARDVLIDAVGVYFGLWFYRDKIPLRIKKWLIKKLP